MMKKILIGSLVVVALTWVSGAVAAAPLVKPTTTTSAPTTTVPPGIVGYEVIRVDAIIPAGYANNTFPQFTLPAQCPSGKRALGGGAAPSNPDTGPNNEGAWVPQFNGPSMSQGVAVGWEGQFKNLGAPPSNSLTIHVWAICGVAA